MRLAAWRLVTVLLVALVMGLAFAHVLERPAKMAYDGSLYTTLQRSLYQKWGPPHIGGFLEPAAILATGLLAVAVRKRKRAFWLTAGALAAMLVAFPVVFFIYNAPVNAAFLGADPGVVPPGWQGLRESWETGHTIRFGLQLLALAFLAVSILYDPRR
jgi:hypothetical protein